MNLKDHITPTTFVQSGSQSASVIYDNMYIFLQQYYNHDIYV